jgi:hypothetical protein
VLHELPLRVGVGLLVQELVEDLRLLQPFGQPVVEVQVPAYPGEVGGQALAERRVVPDPRL